MFSLKIPSPLAQTKKIKNGHVQASSAPLLESTERPQTEVNPPTRRASSCPLQQQWQVWQEPSGKAAPKHVTCQTQTDWRNKISKNVYPCWCSSLKPWLRSLVFGCCVFIEIFGKILWDIKTSKSWYVWSKSFIYLDLRHICPHNLCCKHRFLAVCFRPVSSIRSYNQLCPWYTATVRN